MTELYFDDVNVFECVEGMMEDLWLYVLDLVWKMRNHWKHDLKFRKHYSAFFDEDLEHEVSLLLLVLIHRLFDE